MMNQERLIKTSLRENFVSANAKIKLLYGIIILLVLLLAFIFYREPGAINAFRRSPGPPASMLTEDEMKSPSDTGKPPAGWQNNASGIVKDKTGDSFFLEAEIYDLDKVEKINGATGDPTGTWIVVKKTYKVNVDGETKFQSGDASGIKPDERIAVSSKDSFYEKDEILAHEIFFLKDFSNSRAIAFPVASASMPPAKPDLAPANPE